MTNMPNHLRDIGKQKSFSLYVDQYKVLEELAETKSRSFVSDIVRRGVDLALEEYYRLLEECKSNE